jgi:phosphatidylserine decarboxylase
MTSMHWRSLVGRFPIYGRSPHLAENERTVTLIAGRFKAEPVNGYVVQIAGGSVRGSESYVPEGGSVRRGGVFGMIRIGSQVDLVLTWRESMNVRVRPGQRVRAGETILVD